MTNKKSKWLKFGLLNAGAIAALGIGAHLLKDAPFWRGLEEKVNPTIAEERKVKEEKPAVWKNYQIKDYVEYNRLLPTIEQESQGTDVPLEYLALIALTESTGKGGQRFEHAFQHRYVEPQFASKKNNIFTDLYSTLNKKNPSLTTEEFKRQLATSTGPFQIMYLTAVELGFRGTFEELSDPAVNAHWAALYLQKKGITKDTPLETALTVYNTGSPNGKPHRGYLERAKAYQEMFSEEYRKLFPINK
jgi:hypothetical protein